MSIKQGDLIVLKYEGRFENGEVFDSSSHGEHEHPLEFRVGEGKVIKGFDDAVIGLKIGEEKEFVLKPSEAYGEHKKELQQKVPRSHLPKDHEPEVGMVIVAGTPDGDQFPVQITAVDKNTVTIDLNHPLAGKTLIFKIKIVAINEEPGKYSHKH